jgi:hypothetical protein
MGRTRLEHDYLCSFMISSKQGSCCDVKHFVAKDATFRSQCAHASCWQMVCVVLLLVLDGYAETTAECLEMNVDIVVRNTQSACLLSQSPCSL